MKYSADRPINSIGEDKLGRAVFSRQLAKAIEDYDSDDSIVIGVYGKWGTGKTSILNMTIEELENSSNKRKLIVVKFNPWIYSSQVNLITQYFNCLKVAIEKRFVGKIKKTVGHALATYASVFEVLMVSSNNVALAPMVKDIVKNTGEWLQKDTDLESAKEKLEQALRKEKCRIVVVIDDIDRLTNSQIRDVFQLVKQVGSLPNIIYILSMDRVIVQRALEDVHNCNGNEYLDKIIQLPFEIPELNRMKLQRIFFSKFNEAIQALPSGVQLEQEHLEHVFMYCVDPYISTVRDINRIINIFKFRSSIFYKELSCEDMMGMVALEVLEPKLYKWIYGNKDAVCGGEIHDLSVSIKERNPKEYRETCARIFNELEIDSERALKCLAAMFPVFAYDIGEAYLYCGKQEFNTRGQMRIAQPERFEWYFKLDLEDVLVSREVINRCIYELDKESLINVILKINEDGNIMYFLTEFQSLIDEVPYNRLGQLALVLLNIQYTFEGHEISRVYYFSAGHKARYCVFDLINRIGTTEERYYVYSEAIRYANQYSLGAIAYLINLIELAYGKLVGKTEDKDGQVISLEQLQKLEQEYVKKVQEIVVNRAVIEVEDFNMMFYLWHCLDKNSADEFVKKRLNDELFTLKFVCRMARPWYGSGGNGWNYDEGSYSEYISDKEIYEYVQKLGKNKLKMFTEVELIKLASFVLIYEKTSTRYPTEQNAAQIVAKWKNKN